MKLTTHDWKILQLSLVVLGVVAITALLLLAYTGQQKDRAMQGMEVQKRQLDQARNRFQTSGAEKDTIAQYMPLYLNLVRQGFIGEERRIEWIDDLRTINQQYKLFGINYSIGAQEVYKPPFNVATGSFTLHRSVMKLETPLLHEGDLLSIINALASREHAPFMLRDCVISRTGAAIKTKFVPNLNASCEIDWLSVTEPPRAGGQP
jgi:hypothetical protein